MATLYRTRDGDVLDLICWQHYGLQAGAVEVVLDANPGLADLGPIYATGTLITLPDLDTPAPEPLLRLWG
jgi:phage tail protein X